MGRVLAGIAVLGSLVTALALQSASGASPPGGEVAEERMVLRLHDLPPGYSPLDLSEGGGVEFDCEPIQPFKSTPALARFVRRFEPEGCLGLYLRAYRVPGGAASSPVVGTGALDAGSLEAAEAGFAVARDMLDALVENEKLQEVVPAATIGDATRLFHWKRAPRLFRNGRRGSFLVWRSDRVLAAVFASAGSLETSDRIAEDLARHQQGHVENPTPYKRSERDASEVGLDDPALTFPVHWLGRVFRPSRSLPPIRLESGGTAEKPFRLPGQRLVLAYSRNVYLNSWTRKGWKRFLATPASRIMRTWHCTESTRIAIPGGHATVFAAHGRDFDVCPGRPPTLFFAFAYLDGTVTAVNFVSCPHCAQVPFGPYNSLAGMKAVVRGLTLRQQRTS